MICSLHTRCRLSAFSVVNRVAVQTHMGRLRVQFVAGEFLKMTNLLEGLMQNTSFSLYSLHRGKSYLLSLPFPPKLLRSPTFQRETVGQRKWLPEEMHAGINAFTCIYARSFFKKNMHNLTATKL